MSNSFLPAVKGNMPSVVFPITFWEGITYKSTLPETKSEFPAENWSCWFRWEFPWGALNGKRPTFQSCQAVSFRECFQSSNSQKECPGFPGLFWVPSSQVLFPARINLGGRSPVCFFSDEYGSAAGVLLAPRPQEMWVKPTIAGFDRKQPPSRRMDDW